jgi:hypothetical protein
MKEIECKKCGYFKICYVRHHEKIYCKWYTDKVINIDDWRK